MKAKQIEKLEKQLQFVESELNQKLLSVLPQAIKNGADLYTNSEFNPYGLIPSQHRDNEDLLLLSKSCIDLRTSLHLNPKGSVGYLYLSACQESGDLSNEHRRGPRKLSEWLLSELQ